MSHFIAPKPPYLGAAYYPEDWPLEQIDYDIALMKEVGMNTMRIAEFAWSCMEPQEGQYDFDWLHLAVEKLGVAGIATIMGTPTATPPAWLVERYPETLFIRPDGSPTTHGMRRHHCPNNQIYRDFCSRIVTKMAEEFGNDERVIGWQIDNEIFSPTGPLNSCACPVCIRGFQDFMRERFGTIEKLNQAWCTNLWSQTYQSFGQLQFPRRDVWSHPSILTAWREFADKSYRDFAEDQADILHEKTSQPIGTDMMMILGLDHYATNRKMDIVQYNHYHFGENLWESLFWFDYLRPIKDRPFWNTETSSSWAGSVVAGDSADPGFCRCNSWLPIALGGEANLYWLWRTHWAGQELMCGSILTTSGRPMYVFDEVHEISEGFKAAGDFLNGTKPDDSGLAIHFSNLAHLMYVDQPIVAGFDYQSKFTANIYKPLMQSQFRMDVINPSVDLAKYKMVITPFLAALDEGGLRERIGEWVENGGTWIVGPMSDIRTLDCTKFTDSPYGSLEDMAGIYNRREMPGQTKEFAMQWQDGTRSHGSLWFDGFELKGAKSLAVYIDGPCKGFCAVSEMKLGKGKIVVLGTLLTSQDFVKLITFLGAEVGVTPVAEVSENLLVAPRSGEAGKGMVVVEHSNRPATLTLTSPAKDILTGNTVSGKIELPPYGVMVLV